MPSTTNPQASTKQASTKPTAKPQAPTVRTRKPATAVHAAYGQGRSLQAVLGAGNAVTGYRKVRRTGNNPGSTRNVPLLSGTALAQAQAMAKARAAGSTVAQVAAKHNASVSTVRRALTSLALTQAHNASAKPAAKPAAPKPTPASLATQAPASTPASQGA